MLPSEKKLSKRTRSSVKMIIGPTGFPCCSGSINNNSTSVHSPECFWIGQLIVGSSCL